MFLLEVEKGFRASQGLRSPIRNAQGLPGLQPPDGYELRLKIGIRFDDKQLNDRGWFVDSDAVDAEVDRVAAYLSSESWTSLFDFRPTFEQVSRWLFNELSQKVEQLSYVTIYNHTLGVNTTYNRNEL